MTIPLTNGGFFIVSDLDADLGLHSWARNKRNRVIRKSEGKLIKLHKVVALRMGITGEVDHIDGNGLNNARANLRPATRSQNNCNRGKFKNKVSQYKGVYPNLGRWAARIQIDGKRVWIGRFDSEIEAAKAYDAKARELHAEFAVLNFPDNAALRDCGNDKKRLDWLEEQQALNEAGDSRERWQSWEVTAPADFHGDVREAIDAAMLETGEQTSVERVRAIRDEWDKREPTGEQTKEKE